MVAEAIINGTVEAITRDAFLVMWYRQRRLRSVRWPRDLRSDSRERARYLEAAGLKLDLFDLTSDLPLPLVLLRVTAKCPLRGWPAGGVLLVPGGGFSPEESIAHALKLATSRFVSLCHEHAEHRDPCDAADVARWTRETPFWPGIARYLDPRNGPAHAFLLSAPHSAVDVNELPIWDARSPASSLARLKGWLGERSLCWTAVRLTDPPAISARREVAKVVMPQLMRLTPSREETDLASPRLRTHLPDACLQEPNPNPHPLY
jgi:ribosomal protein S12 methylthiotransferase accessory factor YcaO